jgi:uncharacterized protein
MKLDLSEIAATLGKQYHYEISEPAIESEDVHCVEPVVGSIDFANTGRHIVARGVFKTAVAFECSRCLAELTLPVAVKIEEQFPISNIQAIMAGHGEEIEEEEQEPLFQDNVFDLTEFIRQMILVETPIRPLCSETCKGLCPMCGKNLNEGPCDCPTDLGASPFAVLREMLEEGVGKPEAD